MNSPQDSNQPLKIWLVWFAAVFIFFVATIPSANSAETCPIGWTNIAEFETCLKVYHNKKEWYSARSACQGVGGDLVKIVNSAMHDTIQTILELVGDPEKTHFLIGLSDYKTKGTFRWLDETNEPNLTRLTPKSINHTTCVNIIKGRDEWVNYECDHAEYYICERKPECVRGYYGERCNETCSAHCLGGDTLCNNVNGSCDMGCEPGYQGDLCTKQCDLGLYGEDCARFCSAHCVGANTSCNHVTGTCDLGCEPGYQGDLCIKQCNSGFYGDECLNTCSDHCAGENNSCHHVNGTCDLGCDPGYQSPACTIECVLGFYGKNCANSCSEHCAVDNIHCNHFISCTCGFGCDPGYHMEFCLKQCAMGYYGENCGNSCSDYCGGSNKSCNHVNGTCDLGCDPGYQGDLCKENLQSEETGVICVWVIRGIILAIVAAAGIVVAVVAQRWYRRREDKEDTAKIVGDEIPMF